MAGADEFTAKYDGRELPYVLETIVALRDGTARVSHTPMSASSANASELLRIYEGRAKHLTRFSTQHAVRLLRDVEAFCTGLRKMKSERCVAWGVECDPHYLYWFWEWASDGSFIASSKVVDDRKITDAERVILWGDRKNA